MLVCDINIHAFVYILIPQSINERYKGSVAKLVEKVKRRQDPASRAQLKPAWRRVPEDDAMESDSRSSVRGEGTLEDMKSLYWPKVSHAQYTEYDENGRPVKRFRGTGKTHGGVEPPLVIDPEGNASPAEPGEIPGRSNNPGTSGSP
jgi:hypothetical protein